MSNIDEVISIIERNRISSSQVSDTLGKKGVIHGLKPLCSGYHKVGKASYVYTYSCSNYELHRQIQTVPEDSIVVIEGIDCDGQALFGELVSKYLLLYKRCKAIIVLGLVRDAHSLLKERYPIWSFGVTPLGCINSEVQLKKAIQEQAESSYGKFQDGVIVADDSGVVLIPKEQINSKLVKKLEFIELQEDIWFYCVDTLKWSTYDTICKKLYLSNSSVLPANLLNRLKEFDVYEQT